MKAFKIGDKAIIVSMPEKGKSLVNETVTVIKLGGLGTEEDFVPVRTDTGTMLLLKENQLKKISL